MTFIYIKMARSCFDLFRRVIVALSVNLLREKDSCEVAEAFVGL